jgi:ubiquinone/menaquinone biosynthesis C-methylase UbiE
LNPRFGADNLQGPLDFEDLKHNRDAWNRMAANDHALTRVARDEEFQDPLKVIDASGWLTNGIRGWNVLCLAAGGGRHGPLYAAAGAQVTVVDLSPAMLEHDRIVAESRKLRMRLIEASMDKLSMLGDGEFDLVIHPVSTCYLPRVDRVFQEVARVTRGGGLYISQHKQPVNLQASLETYTGQYVIEHAYYDRNSVPNASKPSMLREPHTREYVHSWSAILGGICRSGFQIEDVSEPNHAKSDALPGSFGHRCHYIAPYIRIKAKRINQQARQLLLQ